MARAGTLHFSRIIFFFVVPSILVSATIQISLQGAGAAQAGAVGTAVWTRTDGDPTNFVMATVKTDEISGKPVTSSPIQVPDTDATSGSVNFVFSAAGIFHLIAYVLASNDPLHPSNLLAQSQDFGVNPPAGLSSAPTGLTTSQSSASFSTVLSTAPSISTTSQSIVSPSAGLLSTIIGFTTIQAVTDVPSTSATILSSPSSTATNFLTTKHTSEIPVIAGSIIGAVVLLATFGAYYILVHRRKRRSLASVSSYADHSHQDLEPGPIPPVFSRYAQNANPTGLLRPFPLGLEKSSPSHYLLPVVTTPETSNSGDGRAHIESLTRQQVILETRIHTLEAQLQNQNGGRMNIREDAAVSELQRRIELLTGLQESNWALGLTDEMPPEYIESMNPFNGDTEVRNSDTA